MKQIVPALVLVVALGGTSASAQGTEPDVTQLVDLVERGQGEEVKRDLPSLLARSPNNPGLLYVQGLVTEEGAEAVRIYQSVVRGEPGRALVDYKDSAGNKTLRINFAGDWTGGCRYYVSMDRASSRKFKDNVKDLASESAYEILDGLKPVSFSLKSDIQPRSYLGFIAEDVPQEVGAADRAAVNTDHIVAVLTRVVKDQQQELQSLRDRVLSLAGTV